MCIWSPSVATRYRTAAAPPATLDHCRTARSEQTATDEPRYRRQKNRPYGTLKVLQRNGKHRPRYSGDDASRRLPQVNWGIVRPVASALAPTDPGPDPGGEGSGGGGVRADAGVVECVGSAVASSEGSDAAVFKGEDVVVAVVVRSGPVFVQAWGV